MQRDALMVYPRFSVEYVLYVGCLEKKENKKKEEENIAITRTGCVLIQLVCGLFPSVPRRGWENGPDNPM